MSEQRISNRARVLAIPAAGAAVLGISIFSRGGSAQDTTATPAASPAASPAAGLATTFDVVAGDIFYDVKEITAPANTDVTIKVTNQGAAQHDLVFDALNVGTPLLNPHESAEIVVNAPAGEYEYHCSVPGHKAAGMVGKLTLVDEPVPDTAAAGGAKFDVIAGDIYFDPKEFTIPANTDVEVTITNIGAAAHDFHIEALKIATPMLNPGGSDTVTINAAPGEYEYFCSVPGHKAAGMAGTLTVQ
jgi:nitrite reductase (NO-forming)